MIRPEIQKLVERGNITTAELHMLRCNSWEWAAIMPKLDDDAFLEQFRHALSNCAHARVPPIVYEESVTSIFAPELIERFKELKDSPSRQTIDVAASAVDRLFAEYIEGCESRVLGQHMTNAGEERLRHQALAASDLRERVRSVLAGLT